MAINKAKLILQNWWVFVWIFLIHWLTLLYIQNSPANPFTRPLFVLAIYATMFLGMIGVSLAKPYTIYERFLFGLALRDIAIVCVGSLIYFGIVMFNGALYTNSVSQATYTQLSIIVITILGGGLTIIAGSTTAFVIGHVFKILAFVPGRDSLIMSPK